MAWRGAALGFISGESLLSVLLGLPNFLQAFTGHLCVGGVVCCVCFDFGSRVVSYFSSFLSLLFICVGSVSWRCYLIYLSLPFAVLPIFWLSSRGRAIGGFECPRVEDGIEIVHAGERRG